MLMTAGSLNKSAHSFACCSTQTGKQLQSLLSPTPISYFAPFSFFSQNLKSTLTQILGLTIVYLVYLLLIMISTLPWIPFIMQYMIKFISHHSQMPIDVMYSFVWCISCINFIETTCPPLKKDTNENMIHWTDIIILLTIFLKMSKALGQVLHENTCEQKTMERCTAVLTVKKVIYWWCEQARSIKPTAFILI